MTVSAVHLLTAASDADATSYTTASITPVSGRLVLAWVSNEVTAGTADVPTLAGNSLNYVQVATVAVGQTRLTLFRAFGLGPVAGTVTIDFAGTTQIGASWSFSSFAGVNQGGTDGSAAVVQSATNSNTSTTITATLAAFVAGNATAGGFRHSLAENATAGTGFAILGQASGAAPARNTATEFRSTTDTTVDATWATSAANLAIAVEISAATAAEPLGIGPPFVVDAPTRDPWPTGLVQTLRPLGHVIDHGDDRFNSGVGFSPLACEAIESFDICTVVNLAATPNRPAKRSFAPLTLVGHDICSPVQWRTNDGQARAKEHLLLLSSKAIEADLWTAMAVASTTILIAGAQTLAVGLSILVQGIANGSAGSGVIHARPRLVEMWDAVGMLHRGDDGVIRTITGIPVVAGSGYPGTGPAAQAVTENSEWAYITDAMDVHVGPAIGVPDNITQATDRANNITAWRIEMAAVAVWGGCVTATVEIDPTP